MMPGWYVSACDLKNRLMCTDGDELAEFFGYETVDDCWNDLIDLSKALSVLGRMLKEEGEGK